MDSTWQYGGCMMNFINGIIELIQRINWIWIGLIVISFTIWYYVIKLIFKILN